MIRSLESLKSLLNSRRCYSAYEHSLLHAINPQLATHAAIASKQNAAATALPLDISLETVISVVLICTGLVLGAEELKPIQWRVWAGKMERSGGGGPYQGLEERPGFVDIRVRQNVPLTHNPSGMRKLTAS